jgi:hypothetical protein
MKRNPDKNQTTKISEKLAFDVITKYKFKNFNIDLENQLLIWGPVFANYRLSRSRKKDRFPSIPFKLTEELKISLKKDEAKYAFFPDFGLIDKKMISKIFDDNIKLPQANIENHFYK